jgi:phage terminase Nu1 subunit (DNA packaging protein)
MSEEILKIEADSKGVWLSALSDDFTLATVTNFLRGKGVRKYDEKAVEEFSKQKNRTPLKIAERNSLTEKHAVVVVQASKDKMTATVTSSISRISTSFSTALLSIPKTTFFRPRDSITSDTLGHG